MSKKEFMNRLVTAVIFAAAGIVIALNPGASADLICTGLGVATARSLSSSTSPRGTASRAIRCRWA